MPPAKASPAKKDKAKVPPFSTAPEDWSRAVFEPVRLSGQGVGGAGGRVPRVAISHGTMRRLRLAVGEEVLLLPEHIACITLGAGEARSDGEGETLLATLGRAARGGALCSALAWPSAATGACTICVSDGTREVLGLQNGSLVVLCRRSAIDSHGADPSFGPRLPQAARLIVAPVEGQAWQGGVGAGDTGGASRAAAAVLLSQLVGRVVCGGMRVSVSLHGRPLILVVDQVDSPATRPGVLANGGGDALGGLAVVSRETSVTLASAASPHSLLHAGGGGGLDEAAASRHAGDEDDCRETGAGEARVQDEGHTSGGGSAGVKELRLVLQDVGGCEGAARALVEAMCGGLQLAHEYEAIGLQPPRGVLMYGPPGTGKTLLARTAAKALGAVLLCVDAPELVGGVYGDSERRISELFATARAAPAAVIFIDEIDVICGHRSSAAGEMERRIVASLVHHLDSLSTRTNGSGGGQGGRVVLVAATNRPDAVDAALRQPGR